VHANAAPAVRTGVERLALAGRAGANVGAGLSSARGRGRFGLSGSGNTDVARSPAGSERELERRKVREQTGAALREDERELEHRKVRERADDDRLGGRERERGFEHRKVNEDASVSSEAERAAGTRARTGASRGEPGRGRCWIRSDLDLEHRKVNEAGALQGGTYGNRASRGARGTCGPRGSARRA